ncbi:MAG: YafY family transcriptional regulator [Bacteroidales bacterium]|nr:MAG: YafY family transcriptional regulator [Bacteroidales bacterium]
MNRIDRLAAIITYLQSKRIVTAQQIADRFEISLRTVYRDVSALMESGIPIAGEAGRGYSIETGYHLPPIMFTHEEAAAMITAGKMTEKLTDFSLEKNYNSALEKVKAVMRYGDKENLEKLEKQILVIYPRTEKEIFPNCFMSPIQKALGKNNVITLDYLSNSKKESTKRKIEPIGICFYGGKWHLLAYCRLRKDYRDFRVDRIKNLTIENETFQAVHPPVNELIWRFTDKSSNIRVVLRFPKFLYNQLSEYKHYYGFIDETIEEESFTMIFLTDSLEWIEYWLLTFGKNIEIIEPQVLKENIRLRVIELFNHYN